MEDVQSLSVNDGIYRGENQKQEAEDFKINLRRILKLNASVKNFELNSKNDELSILHVDECKNLEEAQGIIQKFNFKKAPNIFAIVIETKNENSKGLEKLQVEIIGKFEENHPLVLQISCGNSKTFYVKKNEKFEKLNLNLARETLVEQLNQSTFTVESFFNILKLKNRSIIDADLSEITEFLKLSQVDKLFNFALNEQDEVCFRLLKLFNVNFSQEIQAEILNDAISTNNFELFFACFNKFNPDDVKKVEVERILALKNNENIFLIAIECKNLEVVNFLLKFSKDFESFFNFNLWKSAWDLAINREFFEISHELQNAEFSFTKDEIEVKNSSIAKYKKILTKIASFHENILRDNFEEVENFAESHSNLRLCYGDRQMCALEWAITCKKIEIFAFLRSKGFYTDQSDQLFRKIEQLTENQKKEIRDENLKYTISDPDAFIGILLSKCTFDASSSLHFEEIRQMLVDLSKIKQFRPVMEIVALSDVKIVFDFKTESVRSMDPTRDEHHMGIAYFKQGILYVGKNANKNQLYGTFAHEMTHLALYLIYENNCLPFCEGDNSKKAKWLEVVEEMKLIYENNPGGTDDIIKWVFTCYDPGYQQCAEAIVRVNDILAFFFNNPAKIQEIRREFSCLFDFYDNLTLPDLDPESYRLKNLNNEFGLVSKIVENPVKLNLCSQVLIHSNVPHLSIFKLKHDLQQKSSLLAFRFENIFLTLKDFCEMNESNEKLLKSEKVKRIIIDASQCSADDSIQFGNKLTLRRRDFVEYFVVVYKNSNLSLPWFQNTCETFEWQDLDIKSQRYLLKQKVKFQGTLKTFSSLLPEAKITNKVLTELCQNKAISINSHNSIASSEIFVQRKLQKKQETSDLTLNDLIELLLFKPSSKMLISDMAGSGKTFVLKKIRSELLAKFTDIFVVYANFRDFAVDLINEDFKDFQSFVCEKILKLNSALNVAVFNHFYTENRVIVLLDGFDEISQVAKEQAIMLTKLHNHGKLLVTTRDYLEENLETSMNVTSFKLIPYTPLDQTQFIVEYWQNHTKFNIDLIKKCADQLVARLTMILSNSVISFFGLPLILHIFVEFFKSNLSDDFDQVLDHTMKISHAYQELVKSKTNIWSSISNLNNIEYHKNSITLFVLYYFFALKQFIENNNNDFFGINYVEKQWNLKEITKAGLIRLDQDGKIRFIHETVAEYFVSDFIMFNLIHVNAGWKYLDEFVELLVQTLTQERYKIVRFFLNETIHEVDTHSEGFKCLENKLNEKLKRDQNSSQLIANCKVESIYNLALFFSSSVSLLDVGQIFSSFISDKVKKSPAEIGFFFSHIFKLDKEILMKVFLLPDANGFPTFFRFFLNFHEQILAKLKEKNFTREEKSKLFVQKSECGENLLHFVAKEIENGRLEEIFEVIKNNLDRPKLRSLMVSKNNIGWNFLHSCLIQRNNTEEYIYKFLLNFTEENLNLEEIETILTSHDINGDSVLCYVVFTNNSEVFKMFFTFCCQKLFRETFESILRNRKGKRNILEIAKDSKIYETVEEETRKLLIVFDPAEIQQKIKEITQSNYFNETATLNEIRVRMRMENFLIDRVDFKMFLGAENYKKIKLLAFHRDSHKLMWEILEATFNRQEIQDFLSSTDEFGDNFLHNAFKSTENEVFVYAWIKIEKYIENQQELMKYLLTMGRFNRNALLRSIAGQNENSFYFLLEEVFCKYFTLKEFVYESDTRGENLLHNLARYGSVPMLKFALEKLKIEFSPENLSNFIKLKSKTGQNLLHCASVSNKNIKSVEFLVDFLENELGSEEVTKMLGEFDSSNHLPLHCVVLFNNVRIFEYFYTLYENFFNETEITEFCEINENGFSKNICEFARDNADDKEMCEAVEQKRNYLGLRRMSNFYS